MDKKSYLINPSAGKGGMLQLTQDLKSKHRVDFLLNFQIEYDEENCTITLHDQSVHIPGDELESVLITITNPTGEAIASAENFGEPIDVSGLCKNETFYISAEATTKQGCRDCISNYEWHACKGNDSTTLIELGESAGGSKVETATKAEKTTTKTTKTRK